MYDLAPLDRRSVHSLARALVMQAHGFRTLDLLDLSEAPSLQAMNLALGLWRTDPYDSIARWTLQAAAGERMYVQLNRGDLQGALRSVNLCLNAIDKTEMLEPKTDSLDRARTAMEEHRALILARLAETAHTPQR
jgi:hypothetical protein